MPALPSIIPVIRGLFSLVDVLPNMPTVLSIILVSLVHIPPQLCTYASHALEFSQAAQHASAPDSEARPLQRCRLALDTIAAVQ